MRSNDIENWTLNIIERVLSKQPVEDSRVELKSEWPSDPYKAARQLAGHANAARGEPILWLIGIDEKKAEITGADYNEISNWKQSIESCFSELVPNLTNINIPYDSKTVVALLWETDRRPYLVKNPQGGQIGLEVPWREAGSTRTATRTQLLKLLYPLSKIPSFEIIKGYLKISTGERSNSGQILCNGGLSLDVYIIPGSTERVVIPYHKCEAKFKFLSSELVINLGNILFHSSYGYMPSVLGTKYSDAIICTGTEAVINGSGMANIAINNPTISSEKRNLILGEIELMIKILPVGVDIPISIGAKLQQIETPKGSLGHWVLKM